MINYPTFILEGGDATGKATQALLLASFAYYELGIGRVAYISNPVYETLIGRTFGRCLGRWGDEQKIKLGSPEDMAVLVALNRLETVPYLEKLVEENYLLVFNRGPKSNLFGVARRIIADGADWEAMSVEEKKQRVDSILDLDNEFMEVVGREREVVELFLRLSPQEALKLSTQRAASLDGRALDEHEKNLELQALVDRLHTGIAAGEVPGHRLNLVEAARGSLSRRLYPGYSLELNEIMATAENVAEVVAPKFGQLMADEFRRRYSVSVVETGDAVFGYAREGKSVPFEFRRVLGLNDETFLGLESTRPYFFDRVCRTRPEIWRAIDESRRLDREIGLIKEREY